MNKRIDQYLRRQRIRWILNALFWISVVLAAFGVRLGLIRGVALPATPVLEFLTCVRQSPTGAASAVFVGNAASGCPGAFPSGS